MKCRQAGRKISAYLDHELDAESVRELEFHLRQCAECCQYLDEFRGIDAMVLTLPEIEPDTDFAAKILGMAGKSAGSQVPKRLSWFERISGIVREFADLIGSAQSSSTGTLDEFGDFPPLSMSYIYFKLTDNLAAINCRAMMGCPYGT